MTALIKKTSKKDLRQGRHKRIRIKLAGTAETPRLCIYRSLNHIYAQLIDDEKGVTIASSSSITLKLENGGNIEAAKAVGTDIANKALALNIETVVFDRGGYNYHGRIMAVADAAREAGLKF